MPADAPGTSHAVYTDHDFDLAINSPAYRNDPAISTTILYQGGLDPGIPFSNQWGYDNPDMNQIIADAATDARHGRPGGALPPVPADHRRRPAEHQPSWTSCSRPPHSDRVQNVANNPRWAVSSWADIWLAPE